MRTRTFTSIRSLPSCTFWSVCPVWISIAHAPSYSSKFQTLLPVATHCRRILRSYPGDWQVHLVNEATGDADLVTTLPKKPTYQELQELLKRTEGSNSSKPWDERLRRELKFNQDSLKGQR